MRRHPIRSSLPGAVTAGMLLLSLAACRNSHDKGNTPQAQQASASLQNSGNISSSNGPAATTTTPGLKDKQAPSFTLTDLDGKKVSLSSFRGKPVVLNFWATWCGPCKVEMPWFEEFRKKYSSTGLVILGVADDDSSQEAIAKVVKKTGVTYPILLKDQSTVESYGGLEYLPESFYIDPGGKVVLETAGSTAGTAGKDEIERNIQTLLATAGH